MVIDYSGWGTFFRFPFFHCSFSGSNFVADSLNMCTVRKNRKILEIK